MHDLLGRRLGNYRLVRLLGYGGFADVYLGEHIHLDTQAALKVLRARLESEEQERFLQEGRTAAHLSHPSIVRVLDFGIEETVPFLVMEYAPHGTLRQRIPQGTRLSIQEILPLVRQLSSALHYAHEQGVIHRDVKPANMLLNQRDEVLLSDFGIAAIAQSVHGLNGKEVTGTAAYMSPEQIQGRALPASDQYSLGVVLYEWLTGDWPFRGSFTEICSQHLTTSPPPLHEKRPDIPVAVATVVERALAKDPEQRFASMQAFSDAFAEACGNEITVSDEDEVTLRRSLLTDPTLHADERTREASSLPPTMDAPVGGAAAGIPSLPVVPSGKKTEISRRKVIIGTGVALAGVAAIGGATWFLLAHSAPHDASEQFTAPPSPTPASTRVPSVGTTVFTYRQHSESVLSLAWSPNGQYIVSGSADTTARVWKTTQDETLYTYRGHAGLLNSVFSVSWERNGKAIASGSSDQTVQIWEAATGNRLTLYQGHVARVLSVAWSPQTTSIASAGADKTVQLWDAFTGKIGAVYHGHTDTVYVVAWSPDGTLIASGSADKTVHVWEAETQQVVAHYQHTDAVYAVAWSPDGTLLASAGADQRIQIWDARTARQQTTLFISTELTAAITALSWSADGKRIASACTDATVSLWDVEAGKLIYTYKEHAAPVYTVAWVPDGPYLASGSADRTVRIWRGR
jgi:eukaryotic-like serine/threonine-protein kinase